MSLSSCLTLATAHLKRARARLQDLDARSACEERALKDVRVALMNLEERTMVRDHDARVRLLLRVAAAEIALRTPGEDSEAWWFAHQAVEVLTR
jgi:hypothetical protein